MGISLNKRVEQVGITLTKKQLTNIPTMAVCCAIDASGSMSHLFNNGTVQECMERLLAIALKFDDDGQLPVFYFSDRARRAHSDLNAYNMEHYVKKSVSSFSDVLWSGTSYAPCLQEVIDLAIDCERDDGVVPPDTKNIVVYTLWWLWINCVVSCYNFLFKHEEQEIPNYHSDGITPTMCFFITDGLNDDVQESEKIFHESIDSGVYFQLVSIGRSSNFTFLDNMANRYPHVGHVHMTDLNVSDSKLYDEIITEEVVDWIKKWIR